MFWLHVHGGLQGKMPVVAIQVWQLARTVQLAQTWACERIPSDAALGTMYVPESGTFERLLHPVEVPVDRLVCLSRYHGHRAVIEQGGCRAP